MREMPFRACHRTASLQRKRPCAARFTGYSLASNRRVRHRPLRRGWRHGRKTCRTGIQKFVSKQEWLRIRGPNRLVCTILEVVISRKNRQNQLAVVSPWNDQIPAQNKPHPALAAIDRVQTWQQDLASGLRPSFKAVAQHENLTVARVSQMMTLSRLSRPTLDRLREILSARRSRNEAFSLRKLFQVARLPAEAQVPTIERMTHRDRLRRSTSPRLQRN